MLSPLLSRRRTALLAGWLPLLALVLLVEGQTAGRAPSADRGPAAEEATPDCGLPPPSAAPALQRAEHLARLGVGRWHAAGFRGRGVKVAVLDAGFRGYRDGLGKALPAQVAAQSFRGDGNLEARESRHGVLCAEVVHALAPDADVLLANWDSDRPETFLEAVRWAREQGARVLSCSLIMPSWSDGEGGGPVNEAVARLLGEGKAPGDALCFASAGNTAQRHWCGAFQPDEAGLHQWRPGRTGNALKPWGGERVAVELYGPADAPYEVLVRDTTTGELAGSGVAQPVLPGSGAGSAVVRFLPRRAHSYEVQVRGNGAAGGGHFHLVALGAGLEHFTSKGSICCPADGPAVLAVGAVDADGRRLFYSACGPNSRRPKPDLVAEVPFPSLCRDRPFTGTSAAAPQAAAVAALLWSRHPDWNAGQVRAALLASARDLGPPGHDWETGYGRIALP
jgi:subtilisin family serine protease